MKWGNVEFEKKKIAGATVNQPRRKSLFLCCTTTKIISLPHAICKPFFVTREPDRYTVGMDSTYQRASFYNLSLTEWAFLSLVAVGIVILFVQYMWLIYDLDRAFRAWLQVAR